MASVIKSRSKASVSKPHAASLGKRLMNSRTQIWKSRLSWYVALAAFLTIATVQIVITGITVKTYEQERLSELVETGRSAIAPLIGTSDQYSTPVRDPDAVRRLFTTTRVAGFTIYSSPSLNLLDDGSAYNGKRVALTLLDPDNIPTDYRSADGSFYEFVLRPYDLSRPYFIVVSMDASHVQPLVQKYVTHNIMIIFIMSAFVTTVLMIALGYWLLEPILFLREMLLRASEDPENPKVPESPFNPRDEIGSAITVAGGLIHQNADNIKRIKTAAEDQIHKLAYYDTLTGLPNRTLFVQTLNEQARANDSDNPGRFAVIAMDLDHFKDINDTMGHNIGDAILRAVGKRLRASMPETAVVARSGEDEFAITMPLAGSNLTARDIAQRVAGVIRNEPFKVFNESFQIRSSIGVSTYPKDGTDPDQVLKNADIALNRAKEDGRDTIKEYSEDYDRAVQARFQMLRDLRDAMEQDHLLLHYQPQLDLRSGRIIGAEALLRWWKPEDNPEGGRFIPPSDFVPIAEQSGLIVPIGEMVMRTGCQAAADWKKAGYDFRIAVNVSGAQFYQSDLVAFTAKLLQETGLPPKCLELEVTESVFMEDINHAIQTLQDLHSLGIELAIDDFGTGYSSLSYLRQFPIDRLKIDQSFIRNALNNPDDAAIARTIVKLGHSLNLKVIAEGVETREHEAFLMAEECDEVQGFRYSRPIPLDKFNDFAASHDNDLKRFDNAS